MPAAARARLVSFVCALVAALLACAVTDETVADTRGVVDGDRVTLASGETAWLVADDLVGDVTVDVPAGADDVVVPVSVDGARVALRGGVPALTLVHLRDADGRAVELTVHVLPSAHVQPDDAPRLALSR